MKLHHSLCLIGVLTLPLSLPGQTFDFSKTYRVDVIQSLDKEQVADVVSSVKQLDFVRLETKPDCYISFFHDHVVGKKFIAVTDRKSIFLFDQMGKFKTRIGKIGKGPGEFVSAEAIALTPDEDGLAVLDLERQQWLRYGTDGRVQKQIDLGQLGLNYLVRNFCFLDQRTIVMALDHPRTKPDQEFRSLIFLDAFDGRIIKKNIGHDLSMEGKMLRPYFTEVPGGLLFYETNIDTVYFIDKHQKVNPVLVLDFGRQKGKARSPNDLLEGKSPDGYHFGISVYQNAPLVRVVKNNEVDYLMPAQNGQVWRNVTASMNDNSRFGIGLPVANYSIRAQSFYQAYLPGLRDLVELSEQIDKKRKTKTPESDRLLSFLKSTDANDNPVFVMFRQ